MTSNHYRCASLCPAMFLVSLLLLILSCAPEQSEGVDVSRGWRFAPDARDRGVDEKWYRASYLDTGWSAMDAGRCWELQGHEDYDGIGWYRRTIEIADPQQSYALFFRGVDDRAEVWLNGKPLGSHQGSRDPFYLVLGQGADHGENVIAMRVADDGGPGGLCGEVILIPERQGQSLYKTPFSDEHARPSPDWVRNAVIYEVYLRSFSAEGTFEGLRRRIPELKDLGMTVVWLMPIHPVGVKERKGTLGSPYAVQDYYGINPEFGTSEDFQNLVSTIHDNGMHIVLDLVANHTSWDNNLLTEHPEWYTTDTWGMIQSPNPDWFDVADLDYGNAGVRAAMLAVMRYWVNTYDIDGYRCDVAELVPLNFWEQGRAEVDRIKPVLMISEGSLPEHHLGAFDVTYAWNTYDLLADLLAGKVQADALADVLLRERLAFPGSSLRLRFNANHDKNAWDAPALTKFTGPGMKLTSVLMFTLPGVPLVYNGQEVGNTRRLDLFEKVRIDWSDKSEYWPFYRNLARMRREHPVFVSGEYQQLIAPESPQVFSFARTGEEETALVALNFGNDTVTVKVTVPIAATLPAREYFSGERFELSAGTLTAKLEPKGFRVFVFTR